MAKATRHWPLIHLPLTIKLDPMPRSLIRGKGGGKGRKRQRQLVAKMWEVVKMSRELGNEILLIMRLIINQTIL
jgi:hypothetical protein